MTDQLIDRVTWPVWRQTSGAHGPGESLIVEVCDFADVPTVLDVHRVRAGLPLVLGDFRASPRTSVLGIAYRGWVNGEDSACLLLVDDRGDARSVHDTGTGPRVNAVSGGPLLALARATLARVDMTDPLEREISDLIGGAS